MVLRGGPNYIQLVGGIGRRIREAKEEVEVESYA